MSAKKNASFGVDDFVDSALAAAAEHFGKEHCYAASDHQKSFNVLPVPPLVLQWMIESNGWPLGRMTQSGGPFGTHKSSFIFQLIKWYLEAGGMAVLIDTENKVSDSLMKSMIPAEYFDAENPKSRRFHIYTASTVNQWQQMIRTQKELIDTKVEAIGRKPNFPILWAVDSMKGGMSAEGLETLKSEGEAAGRGYSDIPILISQFMASMPDTLLGLPITLHMSHHEKPGLGQPGMVRSGGKAPDFYATLDIQFSRGGVTAMGKSREYDRVELQGKNIEMSIRKSSMGSDVGKDIAVSFCWKFVDGKQISWWDWDSATAMLMINQAKRLKDAGVMDVNKLETTNQGMKVYSDAIGIKREDAMPAREFGALIEGQPELRAKVTEALQVIRQNVVFDGDMA